MPEIFVPPGFGVRDYQERAHDAIYEGWHNGHPSVLCVMPTGTGKTVVASIVIQTALTMGRHALFLAHREELIDQAYRTFTQFGFACAIEMADQRESEYRAINGQPDVVIATVQTLKGARLAQKDPNAYGLVIVDEAHHASAKSYRRILNYFDSAWKLGITATPRRGDKKNIGSSFGHLAFRYSLIEAIDEGWLAPIVTKQIPVPIDLRELNTIGDDFNEGDLAARIGPMIETLAYNVAAHIGQRQTVIFLPDVGCSLAMADMLTSMGVPSRYVAGTQGKYGMPKSKRREILAEYRENKFQVITCCDLLTEGWDVPQVSCVVNLRPTKSASAYAQRVGRGTRPCQSQGKRDCLILDFDWQCDESSRDLCLPFTLVCDQDDEDLESLFKDTAARKAKRGETVDLRSLLREIERNRSWLPRLKVEFTGRYAHKYAAIELDTIGAYKVLGVKSRQRHDFDLTRVGQATPGQISALSKFGVRNPEKLTKWGASKLLSKLRSRQKKGLASFQQVKVLLANGVNEEQARNLTVREAASVIADIKGRQAMSQQELFT